MLQQNVKIFFDEELHKYTDEYGNTYTSVTTLIGKYANKFDVDTMARNCARAGRKGNPKYKGKTEAMLKAEWAWMTKIACEEGSDKHNFLETTIKQHTGYSLTGKQNYINGRIYTIKDIVDNPTFGRLDLAFFETNGIKNRYPTIYAILETLHNQGYAFYAEIGVYNTDYLISGLIDLLAIKDNYFYIIDWKTNKAPIRYEAGYFTKDIKGNLTNEFVFTFTKLKKPLEHLEDSTGNKYALQLSMYAYLTELFVKNTIPLVCKGLLLCHITKKEDLFGTVTELVNPMIIPFLKEDVIEMMSDFKRGSSKKQQTKMTDLLLQL